MAIIIAIPILSMLVILQSAIVSQVHLIHGSADLVLLALIAWAVQQRVTTAWHWCAIGGLLVSIASAMPPGTVLIGYLLATGVALALRQRVWEVPFLAMITATFVGTLITQAIAIFTLNFSGIPIPWNQAFNLITLPSALLNLALAIPMFALIGDLANWLYPEEIEI